MAMAITWHFLDVSDGGRKEYSGSVLLGVCSVVLWCICGACLGRKGERLLFILVDVVRCDGSGSICLVL